MIPCAARSASDTQAYVAVRPDAVVAAFRGTEPTRLADWATDVLAGQVAFESLFGIPGWGRVHAGFARGLASILAPVVEALAGHDDDRRTLWLTGHSLGGALAVVAAAVIGNLPAHPIAGVYTFGQPRVGDPAFAARYRQAGLAARTFRCVNDRDLVPHLPPRQLSRVESLALGGPVATLSDLRRALVANEVALTYEHAGELHLLLPAGGETSEPAQERQREPDFLARPRPLGVPGPDLARLLALFPVLLKDHAPINPITRDGYVERLEALPR